MLKETMTGIPEVYTKHDDVWKGSVLGKFVEVTFPRTDSRASGVLQLVH